MFTVTSFSVSTTNSNLNYSNGKCRIEQNLKTNFDGRTQEHLSVMWEGEGVLMGLLKAQIQAVVRVVNMGHWKGRRDVRHPWERAFLPPAVTHLAFFVCILQVHVLILDINCFFLFNQNCLKIRIQSSFHYGLAGKNQQPPPLNKLIFKINEPT